MNYFKSVVKNVYQRVIQDEYLQNLSQQQVYFILNNTSRKRLLSYGHDPRKLSSTEIQEQLIEKAQQMGNVTPEKLFRLVGNGNQPNLQLISTKIKQLNENLQQVTQLMCNNFPKYQQKLNTSITEIDTLKNIYTLRVYSIQLRKKLKKLQQASHKSKRITQLNIKSKNMRMLQKYLIEIPNIKKMTLTQLKSINITNIQNKSQLANLNCLKGLQIFINKAVSQQLSKVLQKIKLCLIDKFKQIQYQNALKDFIIAQHQTIKYQVLLIKIIENQIRHVDTQYSSQNNILQICQCYIKFIINLHEVFRWHRLHQKQQKWQNLSKDYYGISIQIDINKITKKITKIMDECIKDIILQKYYHTDNISQYLQNLYLMCRISQIVYTFSGQYFIQTIKQVTQFLYKKLLKIKQKSTNQLQQTYKFQQKNNWNRLPVIDNYSHQPIDRIIYQIYKHKNNNQNYNRVIQVLSKSINMFKEMKMMVGNMGELVSRGVVQCNFWESVWKNKDLEIVTNYYSINKKQHSNSSNNKIVKSNSLEIDKVPLFSKQNLTSTIKDNNNKINKQQQNNKQQKQQQQPQTRLRVPSSYSTYCQQTWQIQPTKFIHFDKFQKYKYLVIFNPSTSITAAMNNQPSSLTLIPNNTSSSLSSSLSTSQTLITNTNNNNNNNNNNPIHITIICQYSLTILKYIQLFTKYAFYYPIQPILSFCLANISLIIQNYIYQIFNNFISNNIKGIFYTNINNLQTLQQKYHKVRFHYQYNNITKFISNFKEVNKLTLRQQQQSENSITSSSSVSVNTPLSGKHGHHGHHHGHHQNSPNNGIDGNLNSNMMKQNLLVRSRVVALESLGYVIGYYQHILKISGFISSKKQSQQQQPSKSPSPNNNNISSISQLHPQLSQTLQKKLSLYSILYSQLSQLIYTDCIPKLCNLKNTVSLIQSIKWNDDQPINKQYIQIFGKSCNQFYYKLISSNRGQIPLNICQRLYGVYWRTQLTTIMKTFMNSYKPTNSKNLYNNNNNNNTNTNINININPKNKLQKFIDNLYQIVTSVVRDKTYLQIPYQKIKAIFPILIQTNWQNTLELLKISLFKYQFIYAVCLGLALTSQSCCYLGNQDMQEKKKIIENWIQENLIEGFIEKEKEKEKEKDGA